MGSLPKARSTDKACVKSSPQWLPFKEGDSKHARHKITWSTALLQLWWTGWKSFISLDTGDSAMLQKTAQAQIKTGFFSQCPGSKKCQSGGCPQTLRQYHPRCAIKSSVLKKRIIEEVVVDACKMPNVLLPDWKAQHIQQLHKVAHTATEEA